MVPPNIFIVFEAKNKKNHIFFVNHQEVVMIYKKYVKIKILSKYLFIIT
ncbi:hypothetical protein ANACAC_02048 [Anaerostipes caccae L1-92]|uniref:Uncharacterized protein n=1 Tax=Anaerostipes caccae (strain DSM 14662 / CCUG 47493 / JCM 13470 / NCIMB 13811 / L1-92) TaxID=411490 RepID=B0MEP9_ANACD|nr:hypothetical protein ANACAC_02048 [Anaerostipes caccae L1-92]